MHAKSPKSAVGRETPHNNRSRAGGAEPGGVLLHLDLRLRLLDVLFVHLAGINQLHDEPKGPTRKALSKASMRVKCTDERGAAY